MKIASFETGEIWIHEHGPKGGDEINIIKCLVKIMVGQKVVLWR